MSFVNQPSAVRGTQCGDGFIVGPLLMHKLAVRWGLGPDAIEERIDAMRKLVENGPAGAYRSRVRLAAHRTRNSVADVLQEIAAADMQRPATGFRTRVLAPEASAPGKPLQREPGRLRLTVITGGLGSGKTRLLNRLLRHPDMQDALVFINELGREPVDQLFAREGSAVRDVELLGGGCLCCKLGDDLVGALRAVADRNAHSPRFGRVVVETSGEADPLDIVQAIAQDGHLRGALDIAGVVTTVDMQAFGDEGQLTPLQARQLAAAHWIVPTKADLLDPEQYAAGLQQLRALAPWAELLCDPPADALLQRLDVAAPAQAARAAVAQEFARRHASHRARHEEETQAVTLLRGRIPVDGLRLFVETLMLAKGDELFRLKGEVEVDAGRHLLLQGVRTSLHEILESNGSLPGTRLTLIGRRIDAAGAGRLLDACIAHARRDLKPAAPLGPASRPPARTGDRTARG